MSTRSPKVSEAPASCQPSSSCLDSSRVLDPAPDLGAVPVARPPLLARRLVRLRACRSHLSPVRRRKREMIPADKKDASYWDKRRKNNEAAKRSREKRRINDLLMEGQLLALSEENAQLRAQVLNLQYHTNLSVEQGKTASACAASPASVLASTLPLSPHSPAFLQGPMRLSGPRVLSHGESAGVCRPAEVDIDSHRQVNSEDISMSADASPQPFSALPGLLSPFDPHHTSTVPYPHPNWVLPHLNHPAMWRPSYLQKPTVYPGRSVQMQGRHAQRVGVEEHIQRRLMSRLSTEQ
ncbi:nuclear factor interleukin-3-regulated protein isoform X2 [Cyprinodon tularosa]|uniref:nuclear factor interleukin-3-regulated protein isoform X2 n=1 Tax=Cyprinodon tularosa TaxID=77115 RepID=UPI0018E24A9B|nr:nuclear factor interleukin-3-regulated protein isoform X2 [Cyprinodon tularosa]